MIVKIPKNYISSRWHSYFIYEEGKRIGQFKLEHITSNEIVFWSFDIKENFRRKGYAKKAISDLINKLKNLYSNIILKLYVMIDNLIAIDLYKKVGFNITSTKGCHEMTLNI